MICQYAYLSQYPTVFRKMTGLWLPAFADLVADLLPQMAAAHQQRLARPDRRRAPGAGRPQELTLTDQILMTVLWLRQYPTHAVLGFLFGVSESTAARVIHRVLPLLEAAGKDTMRMPDPGRKRHKELDALLADTPALAVIIDSFEQRVQRPRDRTTADQYYSGKKKQHTLKTQVTIDEETGMVCDISDSVPGPTADITLLKQSEVLDRLPSGVGAIGDLAYVGIADLHPTHQGAAPRRKPRGKDRPPEDIVFNQAFSRRRIKVEHTIGRMRRFQSLTQTDRHHRQQHAPRVRAVAGLVNRRLRVWCTP